MKDRETTGSLSRILRDNIWQFVGAIVGILAILAAYHIVFRERPRKALQLVVLANTSLVEVKQDMVEDIVVIYKGKTISNLSVVQLKVENTGNQPIRKDDYERPICTVFPAGAEIVEAEILESNPPNIGMTVEVPQDGEVLSAWLYPDHQGQEDDEERTLNAAILSPTLLNAGDRVILRFLVINLETSGDTLPFVVDARIVGVTDVQIVSALEEPEPQFQETSTLVQLFALSGAAVGLMGVLLAMLSLRKSFRRVSSKNGSH